VARAVSAGAATLPVSAAAGYAGVVRRVLLALKEQDRLDLLPTVGDLLAVAVLDAAGNLRRPHGDGGLVLVPIPARIGARRARGVDLGTAVARRAAATIRKTGHPASVVPLLRHARPTEDQVGLSAGERAANVSDSLAARRLRRPRTPGHRAAVVVLVDDILTTGATLREAARALRSAQVPPHASAVVAATPPVGLGRRPSPLSLTIDGG
jgi:predicted amidophosphoribosyltransferase